MATTVEPITQKSPPVAPAAGLSTKQRRLALGAAIGVALLAVVLWLAFAGGSRKEAFASRALGQARATADAGNVPLASSQLQKVIQTYRGTAAAAEAILSLNQLRMVNGQSALAATALREFLGAKPDAKFVAPANALLAAALENSGKPAGAAAAYETAASAAGPEYLKADYLVDAGRAFLAAGQREDALKAYRSVVQKYKNAPGFVEAQVRLAELTDGKM